MAEVKVQCFGCQSVVVVEESVLDQREPFECRFCSEDLRPSHTDPNCGFCRGTGYAAVNDVIWICLGAEE